MLATHSDTNRALAILENELGSIKTMYRAHEDEFDKSVNGYKIGSPSLKRPAPTAPPGNFIAGLLAPCLVPGGR